MPKLIINGFLPEAISEEKKYIAVSIYLSRKYNTADAELLIDRIPNEEGVISNYIPDEYIGESITVVVIDLRFREINIELTVEPFGIFHTISLEVDYYYTGDIGNTDLTKIDTQKLYSNAQSSMVKYIHNNTEKLQKSDDKQKIYITGLTRGNSNIENGKREGTLVAIMNHNLWQSGADREEYMIALGASDDNGNFIYELPNIEVGTKIRVHIREFGFKPIGFDTNITKAGFLYAAQLIIDSSISEDVVKEKYPKTLVGIWDTDKEHIKAQERIFASKIKIDSLEEDVSTDI